MALRVEERLKKEFVSALYDSGGGGDADAITSEESHWCPMQFSFLFFSFKVGQ